MSADEIRAMLTSHLESRIESLRAQKQHKTSGIVQQSVKAQPSQSDSKL